MDQSSNVGEEINPFNPALSYAISFYDIKHNFVISCDFQLPIDQIFHSNRLTRDWSLTGITHLSTGFPVTMINNSDNSLIGSNPNDINNSSVDEPDYNGDPLHLSSNPRSNKNNYFSTTAFSMNALGDPGTSKRRFFYGPGQDNYNMALSKKLFFTKSKTLLFRSEAFNIFNHTQSSAHSRSMEISAAQRLARRSVQHRREFCKARLSFLSRSERDLQRRQADRQHSNWSRGGGQESLPSKCGVSYTGDASQGSPK